jgi:hypothetical protein
VHPSLVSRDRLQHVAVCELFRVLKELRFACVSRVGRVLIRCCPRFEQAWLDAIIDTGLVENLEHYRADAQPNGDKTNENEEYVELETAPELLSALEEHVRQLADQIRHESTFSMEIVSAELAWKRKSEAGTSEGSERPPELDELVAGVCVWRSGVWCVAERHHTSALFWFSISSAVFRRRTCFHWNSAAFYHSAPIGY